MKKNSILKVVLVGLILGLLVPAPFASQGLQAEKSSSQTKTIQQDQPNASGLLDPFFTDQGIWNPVNSYQRYRLTELSSADKYQWWYFTINDAQTQTYFAMSYYINICPAQPSLDGVYMIFTMVSPQGNFWMYYKYPRSTMSAITNYWGISYDGGKFSTVPGDGVFKCNGLMNEPQSVWAYDQTNGYTSLSENTVISWNLTYNRVVGCFAEYDLEGSVAAPDIFWNTFAYDCIPSGQVVIGSTTWTFPFQATGTRYRGYIDMNWGVDMLRGTPEINYRWGWFSASQRSSTPSNDIAIIAGIGISDGSMGLTMDTEGIFASSYNTLGKNVVYKQAVGNPLVFQLLWQTSAPGDPVLTCL